MNSQELLSEIRKIKTRSAWADGVKELMFMLVDNANQDTAIEFDDLINISNRPQDLYKCAELLSYGGMLLIYDCDIAELLCTPSELKRKKGGELQPNSRENWLDVQARACYQALRKLRNLMR